MIAIGAEERWHLQLAQRWIVQYNFYLYDRRWGRMFVRMCPYLPFSARVCLNQHHWLANRMREEGMEQDREKLKPRCDGRAAMADAIIALTSNQAMKLQKRIEFQDNWFQYDSPDVPDGDMRVEEVV